MAVVLKKVAPGGTGKTFLTKLILAYVRNQRKIALAVASSGIAATLLPGGIFVVAAKRTPFLKAGRAFKDVHPSELFATAAREAFRSCNITADVVDTVNVGQVYTISSSADGMLTPRHSALRSGVPYDKPVLGVHRLCGSGFQAMVNSAQDIILGAAEISLAGGTENMSAIPFIVRGVRFGAPLDKATVFEDHLKAGSVDSYCNFTMAETAENLAEIYNLKREQADEFAFRSQMKWKTGYEAGAFEAEIAPVSVVVDNKEVTVVKDEHPRWSPSVNCLFCSGKEGSELLGINDGAGVLILASEEAVRKHNLTPLVRVTGWSLAGVEPRVMGLGPVPAIRQLLDAAGLKMSDIDMTEINEQFAAQALASVIELDVDHDKLNMNGGAIALGHPAGASGARIAAHLTHELRRRRLKRGIGSTCIGGGQGIAVLMETV